MSFSKDEIARYYEVSEEQYRRIWQLNKSRSLHYGYWDSSTKNLHQALININAILSARAKIQPGENILDAGCGVGGSSLWLGKHKSCRVTGISLSAKQVAAANALAIQEGLHKQVHFERRDFTSTGFPDASFDIIWAIESVCHAIDKNDFIKEAFRVLKPGGRLVIADFFKQPGLTGTDAVMIQEWANGWAVDDFEMIASFEKKLSLAGFSAISTEDATNAIRPSAKRLYLSYFPGALVGFLYRLFHPRATAFGKKNIRTAYLQYITLQKKLWEYHIIVVNKLIL
jgi:cyclopropane fatty-acyl-phospholipid synthase-like methyltransferase